MCAYIYDNYYDDYDFFHLGDDDMWLFVQNMRRYLNSDEIFLAERHGDDVGEGEGHDSLDDEEGQQQYLFPLFMGHVFANKGDPNLLFNSGGPGTFFGCVLGKGSRLSIILFWT